MHRVTLKSIRTVLAALLITLVPAFAPSVQAAEIAGGDLVEKFEISGLLEIEASSFDDDFTGAEGTDIILATVELGFDAIVNSNISGHILLLHEEDSTPIVVDEGYITISTGNDISITAGQMYIPFGMYNSFMVTDPMTLDLGETNESALLVYFAKDKFEFSAGIFNGAVDEIDGATVNDTVSSYFASVVASDVYKGVTVGASYLSNLGDSDAGLTGGAVVEKTAGYTVFVSGEYGQFAFEAEYVASGEFDVADLDADGDGNGDTPTAYNLEVAYSVNDKTTIAGRYEGNSEFFGNPETRYGAAVSYALFDNVGVALEYLTGEYESGENVSAATLLFALGF